MAAIDDLLELLGEIADLGSVQELAIWDERTKMPPRGGEARSEQLATLTRLRHQRLASDELGRRLEAVEAELDPSASIPDSFEASLARATRRHWEKARRVPAELRGEIDRVASLAEHAWVEARARSDFALLLPHLERLIELKRRYIECFDTEHPYDALLDDFEPGASTERVREVLGRLRAGTVELLERIAAGPVELDASPLHGEFALAEQDELARELAAALPLDPGSWRLDTTLHPFACAISVSDLRITTRFEPEYIGTAIWAVMHEVGHSLYNGGIDPRLDRTSLGGSVSLSFDESQSRLWENWVGRGRPFMGRLLELLRRRFGERFEGIDADGLYRAANRVGATPIRVEADEVTYNVHIALRFELELELFEGRLAPSELAEAWRARTAEYLGLEVADDADGVLQDVHWPSGAFGYFPTYSLGNVIAAQLWERATEALPELDAQIAAGALEPLHRHLSETLYRGGASLEPEEAIEALTGGPLDPEPLLAQLRAKYSELYELGGSANARP